MKDWLKEFGEVFEDGTFILSRESKRKIMRSYAIMNPFIMNHPMELIEIDNETAIFETLYGDFELNRYMPEPPNYSLD